jgi:hypothetical protein
VGGDVNGMRGTAIAMTPGGLVSFVKRRALGETLISMAALCALVGLLAAFDPRVREQIAMRMSAGQPAAQVAGAGVMARNLATVVFLAARDQSIEHAPLVIFGVVAVVLLLFMLKT